jgi:hypothetical protein
VINDGLLFYYQVFVNRQALRNKVTVTFVFAYGVLAQRMSKINLAFRSLQMLHIPVANTLVSASITAFNNNISGKYTTSGVVSP